MYNYYLTCCSYQSSLNDPSCTGHVTTSCCWLFCLNKNKHWIPPKYIYCKILWQYKHFVFYKLNKLFCGWSSFKMGPIHIFLGFAQIIKWNVHNLRSSRALSAAYRLIFVHTLPTKPSLQKIWTTGLMYLGQLLYKKFKHRAGFHITS